MLSGVILCIDDCLQILSLRREMLESHGYVVHTASTAYAGLKLLEELHIDLVLLEYKQEGIDAEAVALHIRQRHPRLPIVLLSAYADMPEQILWLVDEYVLKGAPLEELCGVIERVCNPSNYINKSHAAA